MQVLLSPSQKQFTISSILNNVRSDGRSNTEQKKIQMKINHLQHLPGSCLIVQEMASYGGNDTIHIYAGIKLKIQHIQDSAKLSLQQASKLPPTNVVSLQLGCMGKLSDQEQEKRAFLQQLLKKFIVSQQLAQFEKLLTIPSAKQHYLSMHIDCYLIAQPHQSLLEQMFLCVKTALQNTEIPQFNVMYNQTTNEQTVEVVTMQEQSHLQTMVQQSHQTKKKCYQGLQSLKIIGIVNNNQSAQYVKGMSFVEYESVDDCVLVSSNKERAVGVDLLKGKVKIQQLNQIVKFANLK